MKYKFFIKLLLLFFVIIIFPVFSQGAETGVLSKIEIGSANNNSYNLNLLFNNKFEGKSFIQKKKDGSYSVFITDTELNSGKVKISYNNKSDKYNIVVTAEEKSFIKDKNESSYVKLNVNAPNNYSITLTSKTVDNTKEASNILYSVFYSIILLIIALLAYGAHKIKLFNLFKTDIKSYTIIPSGYISSSRYNTNINSGVQSPIKSSNINKILKSSDENSFSCFDVPVTDELKQQYKKSANPFKSNNLTHSNPITGNNTQNKVSIKSETKKEIITETEKEPELISELKITPTKGFYLTSHNDIFALFGYAGKNVFLLKKFNDLTQINLQARYYDTQKNNDLYIVRLDSYKAMVEISDSEIKELAVL